MICKRLSNLSPGVYFRMGDMSRGQSNGGYIVCDDYVVAIEAPNLEASAEMFDEISGLTDKPVRFLVITHGHWDHDMGVDGFTKKGVTAICNENLRRQYIKDGKSGSYMGVSDRLVLTDNDRNIEFFTVGTVHSASDIFILLPKEGILFSGDSVVSSPGNLWMGECDLENWINTLKSLEELGIRTVCTGHGPVVGYEILKKLRNYLVNLRDEVGYQISKGRSFEMTLKNINVPDRKEWAPEESTFSDHVKAVYTQLTAELPGPQASLTPRALVLIGDHYHPPAYITPSLEPVFERIGMRAQFIYDVTKLNARNLKGVRLLVILRDGMIWPESDSEMVFWLTEEQEKAIAEFVRDGGGFLALHNCTALKSLDDKPSIYRDVLGSSYNGHGPGDERFDVKVVNHDHPVTDGVSDYVAVDERHTPIIHADDIIPLTEAVSGDQRSINGYVRTYGEGRICYLANGHNAEVLQNPQMQRLMVNAILWCLKYPEGIHPLLEHHA